MLPGSSAGWKMLQPGSEAHQNIWPYWFSHWPATAGSLEKRHGSAAPGASPFLDTPETPGDWGYGEEERCYKLLKQTKRSEHWYHVVSDSVDSNMILHKLSIHFQCCLCFRSIIWMSCCFVVCCWTIIMVDFHWFQICWNVMWKKQKCYWWF